VLKLGSFSFNDSAKDSASPTAPDSATVSTGGGSVSDAAVHQARGDANAELQQRPRRKYTKRNSSDSGTDNSTLQARVDSVIAAQLEGLYDPKACGALACLPATILQARTGHDRWKVSEEERLTLGSAYSAALRTLMITNPRALALALAASATLMVYLPRVMSQLNEAAERKKAEKKEEKKT
jgi:hypothetical protein